MRYGWLYLLLLVAGSVSAAQVYRIVDADGNVTYSDRPDGASVEVVFIDTSTATPAPADGASDDVAPAEADGTADAGNADQSDFDGPTDEDMAAERMENCGIALDREARYLVAHRIYRGTEEEREYLNDAELDAIRAQAAADVEEWCN